jgi:sugar phosphate isomerase/epimerase
MKKGTTMRLSCADYSFPLLPYDVNLALIKGLEFDAVDIAVFTGNPNNSADEVIADPAGVGRRVKAMVDDHGLLVADVFPIVITDFRPVFDVQSAAPNNPSAEVRSQAREDFLRFIEFTLVVESPGLTILPGCPFEDSDPSRDWGLATEELAWRVAVAQDAGLELGFEPHIGSITETPEVTAQFVSEVPGLQVCLDFAHFVYQGISQDRIETLLPISRHHQVRQAAAGVMQAISYEGTIDIQRLVGRLIAQGYDGFMATEYVWMQKWDCDRVDNLCETIYVRDQIRQALAG